MIDYHHHSECSVDSETPMRDICRAALERGFTEIAFTEHVDFIPEEPNTGYFEFERYMRSIEECRRQFGDELTVLAAVEVDYCPDFEDEIATWLGGKAFDFVVGSVHYLRGRGNISEPRAMDYFGGRSGAEAYGEYFELVRRSAQTGLWDALGHVDLVKRYGTEKYGPFEPARFRRFLEPILETIIDNGTALEINASGLRQAPGEPYPGLELLSLYRSMGGERITVGSDSHTAHDVGAGVDEAIALAREAGFTHVLAWRERSARPVEISQLLERRIPESVISAR